MNSLSRMDKELLENSKNVKVWKEIQAAKK